MRKILLAVGGLAAGGFQAWLGWKTTPSNPIGWFLVFFGLGYFTGGAVYLAFFSTKRFTKRERGDRSTWLLAPGFLAVFMGSPLTWLLSMRPSLSSGFIWTGAALIAVGFALQIWARRASGRMYTGRVEIQPGHCLVQSGPYRLIRHPAYTSFLLIALGVAVGYASLVGLLAALFLLLPGLVYRLLKEEDMLLAEFGEEYRAYRQHTWRLIPGVF